MKMIRIIQWTISTLFRALFTIAGVIALFVMALALGIFGKK